MDMILIVILILLIFLPVTPTSGVRVFPEPTHEPPKDVTPRGRS